MLTSAIAEQPVGLITKGCNTSLQINRHYCTFLVGGTSTYSGGGWLIARNGTVASVDINETQ